MNNKNKNKLGLSKGAGIQPLLRLLNTKCCFKGASSIDCRVCFFSIWYLVSEWGNCNIYYYKIKYLDKELCPCSGSGYRCELAVPLWQLQNRTGSSVVLGESYRHCSGLGEIPVKMSFFLLIYSCMSVLLTVTRILSSCSSQYKLNLYCHTLLQQWAWKKLLGCPGKAAGVVCGVWSEQALPKARQSGMAAEAVKREQEVLGVTLRGCKQQGARLFF